MYEPHLLLRGGRLAKPLDRLKKIRYILLLPLGAIYGIVGLIRRGLYNRKCFPRYESTLPTIGIGNLTVGGTGKTPMVEYLVRLLKEDLQVATLSRGYKRKTKGYLNSAENGEVDAFSFGDEPAQLHEKFPDIQVVVCEKRTEALRRLEQSEQRPDVVVLDDAYQHLQVRCRLNLLLTDFSRLYCDDFPMPAGRLREFPSAAAGADAVMVTKSPPSLTKEDAAEIRKRLKLKYGQSCFFTTLVYDELTPFSTTAHPEALTPEPPIILLTGIANPTTIHQEISRHFSNVELISYGDHHIFTVKDIQALCQKMAEKGKNAVIITTEKDAMRLRGTNRIAQTEHLPIFVLPVRVQFLFGEEEEFIQMVNKIQ